MNKSMRLVFASMSLFICFFVISGCSANTVTKKSAIENPIINVGDTVLFGKYEQDNDTNNGAEEIEWRVIAIENTKALLISVQCLDGRQYDAEARPVTWEKCSLRSWLNDTFLNTVFSPEEQTAIILSTIENQNNLQYSTYGGNDTQDKIFLLSQNEALEYFAGDDERISAITEYAKAKSGYGYSSFDYSSWWLRSIGQNTDEAVYVGSGGSINGGGCLVNNSSEDGMSLRPALYIDLTSEVVSNMIASGINVNSEISGSVSQTLQISDEPASTESTVSNSNSVTFPADFPADFPMYDDATSGEINREDGKDYPTSIIFYFFFSGNTDKIISWYNSELASKGWTITESSNNN